MSRIFVEEPIDIGPEPERDAPPYRGTEPARYVMRRVMNQLINPQPERPREEQDQFGADLELLDTIDDQRPPMPAGRSAAFPPDEATKKWLNEALDAEMKRDLDRIWSEVEERIDGGNRLAPSDPDEVSWMLAVGRASFSIGQDEKSDGPLLALLRDPAMATIPQWVRDYLARRISGRGPGQPPKSHGQRLEDDKKWLAARDFERLKALLEDIYKDAPRRAKDHDTISKVALEIAMNRWGIRGDRTLRTFLRRSRRDRRRLQF